MTTEGSQIKLLDMADAGKYDSMAENGDGPVQPQKPHVLNKSDRTFLRLVKGGSEWKVKLHLRFNSNTNINAWDHQGRTALTIAVRIQDDDMVELLLKQKNIRMADSVLHAVREGYIDIVEMLLDWQDEHPEVEQPIPGFESAEFPGHMTPLMLGCITDNYEIVQHLLGRGHELKMPSYETFKARVAEDKGANMEYGMARIDTYRAMGTASYLCNKTNDPILSAFTLSNEAEELAFDDPIFKDDYQEISAGCRKIATGLLNEARSSEEVGLLLTREHGDDLGVSTSGNWPRLKLAIAFEQKEFTTHANCQLVLQDIWAGACATAMSSGFWRQLLFFVPRVIILPFVYILYYFLSPCLKIFKTWESPVFRFIGDQISYLVFLSLLVVTISREGATVRVPDMVDGVNICVWIWVAGLIWEQAKTTWFGGIKQYAKQWWLIYGAVMLACFVVAFVFRITAMSQASQHGRAWAQTTRRFWEWNEPTLVAEAFYCLGVTLAFGRILYVFQISQILGPLQLSMARMMSDIMQMMVVMALMICMFGMGLTKLYRGYKGMVQYDEDNQRVEQPEAFVSFTNSFWTLLWTMLGYGDYTYSKVMVDNTCKPFNDTSRCYFDDNSHNLTEGMGYLLYAVYQVIMITILMNMLIAMMSNTFTLIQENANMEWQFARASLWMTYCERAPVLPPPLSLIPSPQKIISFFRWIFYCCCGRKKGKAGWSRDSCWFVETRQDEKQKEVETMRYQAVIQLLMVRLMGTLEEDEEKRFLTVEDLKQLKRDLMKRIGKKKDKEGDDKEDKKDKK